MTFDFGELHQNSEPLGTVSGFVDEFIAAVKPLGYFDGFSRSETVQLTEYFDCFGVPRESVLLAEGAPGDFLIIFLTGSAMICSGAGPKRRFLAEVQPGQMVGEITFFDGLPRTASCVTEEPSDVAVLSRDRFHALQMEHPRLASKFLLFVLQQNVVRLRAMTQTATSVLV